MNSKCIYTVITNDYDELKDPDYVNKDWDYVCFTDNSSLKSVVWDIRLIDQPNKWSYKEIKCLPYKFLPEYKETFYIDGSTIIYRDINVLLDNAKDSDWLAKEHPYRKSIYEESEVLKSKFPDIANDIDSLLNAYGNDIKGLFESGCIYRKNNKAVNEIGYLWLEEIKNKCRRDQLSLSYVFQKTGFKFSHLPAKVFHAYIKIKRHNLRIGKRLADKDYNCYYFFPGRGDRDIGRAMNDHCKLVSNDNDWIITKDRDVMLLNDFCHKQIEDIISKNKDKFDVICGVTNRLHSENQRPFPNDFDNLDLIFHRKRTEELANKFYDNVIPYNKNTAGLILLFKKSVWNKVKFRENDLGFDTDFSKDVRNKGFKIGIAKGLYVFHYYRAHLKDAKNNYPHLI